jgi:hypothetical protein
VMRLPAGSVVLPVVISTGQLLVIVFGSDPSTVVASFHHFVPAGPGRLLRSEDY